MQYEPYWVRNRSLLDISQEASILETQTQKRSPQKSRNSPRKPLVAFLNQSVIQTPYGYTPQIHYSYTMQMRHSHSTEALYTIQISCADILSTWTRATNPRQVVTIWTHHPEIRHGCTSETESRQRCYGDIAQTLQRYYRDNVETRQTHYRSTT